jgi:hypothetical protein
MKLFPIGALLGIAVLVSSAGAATAQGTMQQGGMKMSKTPETVTMKAQNDSGETGTTTLKDTPNGLLVTVNLKGAKGTQPAHIHKGSCANLDPKPEYPLKNVVNGKSVTTVKGVTIGELNGKSAVNVHKSTADLKTYVSCGDIASKSAM